MKKIYFLITVDCDLRISSVKTRQQSLDLLLDVFEKSGLAGRITWFLNENDFAISHSHAGFLQEAVARGDTLGLHDHLDFLCGNWEYAAIRDFCSKSLRDVSRVIEAMGYGGLLPHRFGCLFQHSAAYQALIDLGYAISSDVCPGSKHKNHTGELAYDNLDIPLGILPYRHASHNIADFRSKQGPLIQFPVLQAHLTASWWPKLDRSIIDGWISSAEKLNQEICVMTFLFHPYEIIDTERLKVDEEGLARLEELVAQMRDIYKAEFIAMGECCRKLGFVKGAACPD